MHSYDFFPSNYLARIYIYIYIYIYVWNHCEYSDHAIQAIILSHLWLKWTNMQIRLFFPHYIVLFVILCDGCFFTAEKKGINNKLFQIRWAVFILACKTGALRAKLGERGILHEAWDEGRRKIKLLLPVLCSGSYYAGYLYTKGRIACKLLNAIFYCGKSTRVYCYWVLLALV